MGIFLATFLRFLTGIQTGIYKLLNIKKTYYNQHHKICFKTGTRIFDYE